MTTERKLSADHDLAVWLGDAPGSAAPDPLAEALDRLYAAGPPPAHAARAAAALDRALAARRPAVAYYHGLSHPLVGRVFLAVGERGVLAVSFDRAEPTFQARLRRAGLQPVASPERVASAAAQMRDYLEGRRERFDLPLDLRALSDFQRRVLLAAAEIPRGQVRTYGGLAARIGRPRAARAVGRALGSNPIPIILPCHRVLASDGGLGGYSGGRGVETKRRLLSLEGALPLSAQPERPGRVHPQQEAR